MIVINYYLYAGDRMDTRRRTGLEHRKGTAVSNRACPAVPDCRPFDTDSSEKRPFARLTGIATTQEDEPHVE